jgi:hypothetical protein
MSESTHSWNELRDRLIEGFGDGPSAPQEQAVLEAFRDRPMQVEAIAEETVGAFRAGRVRTGWPFLAKRVLSLARPDVIISDSSERETKVAGAERWIRNAGIFLDRQSELEDELFDGQTAYLRRYREDDSLRQRMIALWEKERPRGEQAEQESLDRAEHWRKVQAELHAVAASAEFEGEEP